MKLRALLAWLVAVGCGTTVQDLGGDAGDDGAAGDRNSNSGGANDAGGASAEAGSGEAQDGGSDARPGGTGGDSGAGEAQGGAFGGEAQGGAGSPQVAAAPRLALGGDSSCFRRDNGSVRCWGLNDRGQLTVVSEHSCAGLPCNDVPTTATALDGASQLALGARFGCALIDGEAVCWGENTFGELARESSDSDSHAQPHALDLQEVTALAAGPHHACALAGGHGYCWGLGEDGRLGLDPAGLERCAVPNELRGKRGVPEAGDAACATAPLLVPAFEGAVQLALGYAHSCARFAGGRVSCVGAGESGQLGGGQALAASFEPVEALAKGATELAAGGRHTCAIAGKNTRCWGDNTLGQLGIGNVAQATCGANPCALSPTLLGDLPPSRRLALGAAFSCAVLEEGTVRCWGADDLGQLGNSSETVDICTASDQETSCLKRPLQYAYDLNDVRELEAGEAHACARLANEVRCWGHAELGQTTAHDLLLTFPSKVYGLE